MNEIERNYFVGVRRLIFSNASFEDLNMTDFTEEQQDSNEIGYYETPQMTETLESCWGLGPLDVCARLVSHDNIEVTIKLSGLKIGSGTISSNNDRVCASANVGLVKAAVCVRADFPNKTVWVEGKVCNRKWNGKWHCNTFKTKLISW